MAATTAVNARPMSTQTTTAVQSADRVAERPSTTESATLYGSITLESEHTSSLTDVSLLVHPSSPDFPHDDLPIRFLNRDSDPECLPEPQLLALTACGDQFVTTSPLAIVTSLDDADLFAPSTTHTGIIDAYGLPSHSETYPASIQHPFANADLESATLVDGTVSSCTLADDRNGQHSDALPKTLDKSLAAVDLPVTSSCESAGWDMYGKHETGPLASSFRRGLLAPRFIRS